MTNQMISISAQQKSPVTDLQPQESLDKNSALIHLNISKIKSSLFANRDNNEFKARLRGVNKMFHLGFFFHPKFVVCLTSKMCTEYKSLLKCL